LIDGGVDSVVLVTAPGSQLVQLPAVSDQRIRRVTNPDPSRGMFSSIQSGLNDADGSPILIMPADMPFVLATTVALVLTAARDNDCIVSPQYDGRRGHPIAVPGRLRSRILAAGVDATLASVLEECGVPRETIDVADPGILRDVDVVGDLAGF
jgi:CTP:molybdopterin cytidylyltransferase MocA